MRRNVQGLSRVGSYQGTEKRAWIILSQTTGLFCLMSETVVSQSKGRHPGKRWNSSIQVSRNLTALLLCDVGRDFLMDHSNMQKALEKAKKELRKQNSRHCEFRQVSINDRDDPAMYKTFLISYPLDYDYTIRMLFGRGTRGMRGWDMEANRMVYIKDYWRAEGGEKEGEIYRSLEEKNVPKIARFYCGNDVCREICENNVSQEGHETVSQTKTSDWTCPRTGSIRHYRMALDRVGRELSEFRSSLSLPLQMPCKVRLFLPMFILRAHVRLCSP